MVVHTWSKPLLKSETKSSQIKTNSVIQLYLFNTDKTNWNMCNQNVFHLTISTWQFVYKILYVCSTAFLLPFGTQMPIVVLLKLSYFLSIKALDIVYSICTVRFNQIVYISSVMIGFAFNFQSSLGYLTIDWCQHDAQ